MAGTAQVGGASPGPPTPQREVTWLQAAGNQDDALRGVAAVPRPSLLPAEKASPTIAVTAPLESTTLLMPCPPDASASAGIRTRCQPRPGSSR